MFWIVVTLLIFGGVYAVLDYLGADENVRTQLFVVLAAIAIWRAMRSREGEPASARSFPYGERWRI